MHYGVTTGWLLQKRNCTNFLLKSPLNVRNLTEQLISDSEIMKTASCWFQINTHQQRHKKQFHRKMSYAVNAGSVAILVRWNYTVNWQPFSSDRLEYQLWRSNEKEVKKAKLHSSILHHCHIQVANLWPLWRFYQLTFVLCGSYA